MPRVKSEEKEQAILEYIKSEIQAKGYPPSIREICQAVDLKSTSSVHSYLNNLEEKGLIERGSTKNRAIKITNDDFGLMDREIMNIPIVGQVAAGCPILAEENIEDYFAMPVSMLPNTSSSNVFMLKVKGESMIDMGIYDGDNLIVSEAQSAKNGEVVVALIDDEATVKRFYKESDHIRLQPENSSMAPIIVPDCQVIGKVIGLVRMNIL